MPCTYDPVPLSKAELDIAAAKRENKELTEELKTTRALLCGACRVLVSKEYDFGENPELDRWWAKHQTADRRREAKERNQLIEEMRKRRVVERAADLMTKPLNQMTDDEKAILKEAGVI